MKRIANEEICNQNKARIQVARCNLNMSKRVATVNQSFNIKKKGVEITCNKFHSVESLKTSTSKKLNEKIN